MDRKEAIDLFETQLQGIVVKDYGDFRRKVNTYFERLLESLDETDLKKGRELEQIKAKLVQVTNGEIEQDRLQILQLFNEFKKK